MDVKARGRESAWNAAYGKVARARQISPDGLTALAAIVSIPPSSSLNFSFAKEDLEAHRVPVTKAAPVETSARR